MKEGQIRIIGGQWRGRKLKVMPLAGLRPTPDRVRETVFNWLAPVLPGAHCLDAFAGSGALGLEALSRGAASVTLVDQASDAIRSITEALTQLKATAEVYQARLPEGLQKPRKPWDIVFLDPPYQADLLLRTAAYLEEHALLASGAYIYLEADHELKPTDLPAQWELLKAKKAGQVAYHLARRLV